jgi:capsular polysaccharide biosynthesis protein
VPGAASPHKTLVELRRRGWLVLLSIVLVAAVAWGAGRVVSRSWSAEAVLVVRAGGPLASQPDASTKLAATYATLVPLDSAISRAVDRALPDAAASSSFSASNDANTAVLRVTYSAPSSRAAIAGVGVVARAISGARPASSSIAPRSVAIVRLPSSATGSGSTPAQLAAVGGALGLLLGLVLVAFWRTRDARVDDVRELRQRLRCPCFAVNPRTLAGLRPLVEALVASTHRNVAVLPSRARDARATAAVHEALAEALGEERVLAAGPPGSDQAGELAAAAADATVLVVARGGRTAELDESLDVLGRYGAAPAYAVLAGGRGAPQPPRVVATDDAAAAAARSAG